MEEKCILYDKDIREPLFDFLEERYGKVRIIEEKQMGRSRADLVMVTEDGLAGLEIKSDADTYARLARQVRDYDRYFDRNYVVAGTSHALHIEEHVPHWWGIITVELQDGRPDFYVLREAEDNPENDISCKLRLLWRPELVHLQMRNELPAYAQKSKEFVIKKLQERVPAELLRRQICEELFERDYTLIEETIADYRRKKAGTGRKKTVSVRRRRG